MMMTISACLWLGLFPLLQTGTYAHITKDKWIFMLILTGVTLVCLVVDLILGRLHARTRSAFPSPRFIPAVIAAALTLCILLSWILSPMDRGGEVIGLTSRREGLLTQLCYLANFFMFAFSRIRKRPVLLSAAAGLAVYFIIIMFQKAGTNPLGLYPAGRYYSPGTEFQGTTGNVDMGTGYLCVLAGLFLTELVNVIRARIRVKRSGQGAAEPVYYLVILALALAMAVFLIFDFRVQFGKVTLAALAGWTFLRLLPKRWRAPVLAVLVVLALAAVWFWPGQSGGIWELHEMFHGRTQLSFGSNRIGVWYYSLQMAPDRLLLGTGPDTFEVRFNTWLKDHNEALPKHQGDLALPAYFDNPHNEYIAHLSNHGLPAALLFIALIVSVLLCGQKKKASGLPEAPLYASPFRAAVFCYAVQAFFSFSVAIQAPFLWVALGLAVSCCTALPAQKTECSSSPVQPSRRRPGRSASGKR